jgi:hypothetical protein
VTIQPIEVGESHDLAYGNSRHRRMLKDREFDIAEMSLASWVAAVAQDPDLPQAGIPIFSRRLFSLGQITWEPSRLPKPARSDWSEGRASFFQTTPRCWPKVISARIRDRLAADSLICKRPEIIDVDLGRLQD